MVTDYSSGRRIALGTAVKSIGEVLAKLASVAFYIVIARELGDSDFGNVVFAISLSGVLFSISAFGTDSLVTREVARDDARAEHLLGAVMSLKLLFGFGLLMVMVGIVLIQGYSQEAGTAIVLIGLGVGLETVTKTVYSIFVARGQIHYEAITLILERFIVTAVGIPAVLLGAGLVVVAVIFAAGSVVGLGVALFWLWRSGWPGWRLNRSRWVSVIKAGIPIGLITILYGALLKIDIALLSFLNGGDNAEVGHYGAAYRMIESTMFISWSFSAALFPWLSRDAAIGAGRVYRLGLKILIAVLMPMALIFGLYAAQIIHLLYGSEYDDAIVPLRVLSSMIVLYGINSMVVLVLITRDRPWDYAAPATLVIVQNLVFNVILIPLYGATGAAANAVISGIILAIITHRQVARIFKDIALPSICISIGAASLVMAGVIVATRSVPWIPAGILATLLYVITFAVIERFAFPEDFSHYAGVLAPVRRFLPSLGRRLPS
ncbi:MAG TPA: flippase [Solirubrobacterales bacterium]